MKKILSFMLTIILTFCMTITAFAATANTNGTVLDPSTTTNSTTADVDVKITGQGNVATVYNVVVKWDSLDFTYNFGTADKWNPAEHKYSADGEGTEGAWANNGSATITVTNHSNAQIRAKASFAGGATSLTRNDVTATLSNPSFTVASAVGTTYNAAPNGTFTCAVSGVPSVTSDFTIGTITITIESVATTE